MLETVERLCPQVAIITRPGKLVWQGDITALDRDGVLAHEGREFRTLEELLPASDRRAVRATRLAVRLGFRDYPERG